LSLRSTLAFRIPVLTQFTDLGLAAPLLKALATEGYEKPTPIQAQAIPHLLQGRDLLGVAQTGTGKTAAFALPILQRLAASGQQKAAPGTCRVLILSPTRELASQIADSFRAYGRHYAFRVTTVFGGVGHRPQTDAIRRGVDILVATPGRLLDHLDSRTLSLGKTEVVVLDEADHMLDLGFIVPIRKIVNALPRERQSLFFSATMPKEIGSLAAGMLRDPVRVSVTPAARTADKVEQRVIFVETSRKRVLLSELLKSETEKAERVLVFARTKHGADRIVKQLEQDGLQAAAIHGNKSQGQRERALAEFRSGKAPILVATDIAARGIDVDGVTHVINFDLPNVAESYVHRIGRTARAGAGGIAISFCDGEERAFLRDIEKLTRQEIPATDRRLPGHTDDQPARRSGPSGRPGEGRQQQRQPRHRNQRPRPDARSSDARDTRAAEPRRHGAKPAGASAAKAEPRRSGNSGGGRGGDLANVGFLHQSTGRRPEKSAAR
jgi:ATP-dependent RNA helicase RhlE